MAVCKECGALNPDSNKFCSECGQPIVKLDSKAIRDAMSQLEAEFEQDALVNLDRSRLTYICDVCGKVNPIDAKQCLRCGKKRPRSEYINALTKIKNSKNLKNAVESMAQADQQQPAPVQQPAPAKAATEFEVPPAPAVTKDECDDAKEERQELSLYRLNPGTTGSEQNRQIVQPFVIVPYVSQNQPLLQYDPNEIYRYVPYTAEEKRAEAERQSKLLEEERAKSSREESDLHARKKREVETMLARKKADQKRAEKAKKPSSAKVSVWSFFALLIAAAGILAAFLDLVVKDFTYASYFKVDFVTAYKELFSEAAISFSTTGDILSFVYAILILAFLAVLAVAVLQNLIRVFTGRVKKRGFLNLIVPILALILAIGIAAVNLVTALVVDELEFTALFQADAVFGWIVALAVAILLTVFYAAAGKRRKKVIPNRTR